MPNAGFEWEQVDSAPGTAVGFSNTLYNSDFMQAIYGIVHVLVGQAVASQYLVVDESFAEWQVFGWLLQTTEGA